MSSAYAIAWIGELGGIQNIEIHSESPKNIERIAPFPFPALLHEAKGKTFADAAAICKAQLRERAPAWERFLRSPARLKPLAQNMRAQAAQAAARAKRR